MATTRTKNFTTTTQEIPQSSTQQIKRLILKPRQSEKEPVESTTSIQPPTSLESPKIIKIKSPKQIKISYPQKILSNQDIVNNIPPASFVSDLPSSVFDYINKTYDIYETYKASMEQQFPYLVKILEPQKKTKKSNEISKIEIEIWRLSTRRGDDIDRLSDYNPYQALDLDLLDIPQPIQILIRPEHTPDPKKVYKEYIHAQEINNKYPGSPNFKPSPYITTPIPPKTYDLFVDMTDFSNSVPSFNFSQNTVEQPLNLTPKSNFISKMSQVGLPDPILNSGIPEFIINQSNISQPITPNSNTFTPIKQKRSYVLT